MNRPTCAKCGSDDVLTRWHGHGPYHVTRRFARCEGRYGPTQGEPRDEHLHYHCRNCQYDWTGDVLGEAQR